MELNTSNPIHVSDERGHFVKCFYENSQPSPSDFPIREVFITSSKKGVIRGLHFQLPPKSQSKVITVLKGRIFEVYVDLRKGSDSYGQPVEIILSEPADKIYPSSLHIPSGFAHGYQVLEEDTIVLYLADHPYDANLDSAISFNSFKIDWPIEKAIVSDKDSSAISFYDFESPYRLK